MPPLGANGAITRASLALGLVEAAEDQGKVVVGGQELTEIMRPQPVVDGDGGHAPARASVGRADQSRPSLCGDGGSVLGLCFSHITVWTDIA
jgi:hypothetical protein